jgi:hypothetical protein
MKKTTAIKIAIEAIKKQRQDFAVEHNLYELKLHSESTERTYKKYERLSEAIDILEDMWMEI